MWLIYIFGVLCITYLAWAVTLYIMQPKFLYRPTRDVIYTPGDMGFDFENVMFETDDSVQLHGWYIPANDAEFTLLFCHANGGNIMHRLDSINIFHKLGVNCFIFDYRGYGNSQGRLTEEGTYQDAMAAYKWLTEEKKVSPETIIILGKSLGGSIAAQLATKVTAGGLVVEGAFTSYADIGRKFYPYMPVRWFTRFNYNTIDYIRNVECPVMFIYSRNDEIIPFEFGPALYEAANEPKEFVEIFGSHNDGFLVSGEIYKQAWIKWLNFLGEYESLAECHQAS